MFPSLLVKVLARRALSITSSSVGKLTNKQKLPLLGTSQWTTTAASDHRLPATVTMSSVQVISINVWHYVFKSLYIIRHACIPKGVRQITRKVTYNFRSNFRYLILCSYYANTTMRLVLNPQKSHVGTTAETLLLCYDACVAQRWHVYKQSWWSKVFMFIKFCFFFYVFECYFVNN